MEVFFDIELNQHYKSLINHNYTKIARVRRVEIDVIPVALFQNQQVVGQREITLHHDLRLMEW